MLKGCTVRTKQLNSPCPFNIIFIQRVLHVAVLLSTEDNSMHRVQALSLHVRPMPEPRQRPYSHSHAARIRRSESVPVVRTLAHCAVAQAQASELYTGHESRERLRLDAMQPDFIDIGSGGEAREGRAKPGAGDSSFGGC